MKKTISTYMLIFVGSVLYALSTVLFIFPHNLLLGGTSGISVILNAYIPVSPGNILMMINFALLVLAFVILGKSMAIKTLVGSVLTTVFIGLFEKAFGFSSPPVANVFLSAVFGAFLIAVASGVMFYADSSSGGTDVIALIVQKYSKINIGKALLLTDFLIVIVGGVLSGYLLLVCSFAGLLIKTLGIDYVISCIKKLRRKSMTTIILVRHGESEANRGEFFAGHLNPELEERGLQQAKLTARYIADTYRVDAVYASDLTRAYKTAECLADILQMPVIKEEGMREINAGAWEGVSFEELWNLYPEDFGIWRRDIANARCTDGESVEELGTRVFDTLTRIAEKEKGKTVVVGTHATPVRAMQSIVKTGSVKGMQDIPWVSNASLTVFEYEDGKWKLIEAGIDKHLSEYVTAIPSKV